VAGTAGKSGAIKGKVPANSVSLVPGGPNSGGPSPSAFESIAIASTRYWEYFDGLLLCFESHLLCAGLESRRPLVHAESWVGVLGSWEDDALWRCPQHHRASGCRPVRREDGDLENSPFLCCLALPPVCYVTTSCDTKQWPWNAPCPPLLGVAQQILTVCGQVKLPARWLRERPCAHVCGSALLPQREPMKQQCHRWAGRRPSWLMDIGIVSSSGGPPSPRGRGTRERYDANQWLCSLIVRLAAP
jgi:hypothetical protein